MRLTEVPPTGIGAENYSDFEKVWKQERKQSFKDFLRSYNNKDVDPTLEAMRKKVEFYHNEEIDMLKLECSLPNLANTCLHSSTSAKFYLFTEHNKDLLSKVPGDMVGGPSIVFTCETFVDETHICKSTNVCRVIVGIDAS